MAENYTVNYTINVKSDTAVTALQSFQQAVNGLDETIKKLNSFKTTITEVGTEMSKLTRTSRKLDFSTSVAKRKLDAIIHKLHTIKKLSAETYGVMEPPKSPKQTPNTSHKAGLKSPKSKPVKAIVNRHSLDSAAYKSLGPSMIDSGGIGIIDMLKGMGIAYGVTGLGSLVGNVVADAAEYNNLIQTTKNILGSHDKKGGFDERFASMERIVRNVGVETKFTAPEVADASKFLAMAGFDVESINKSIRPIADIALVGDTDLGETADVVTNIMTGYGIDADNIKHAADVMTQTFTLSNTTLMEIAEAYKYSASLLSAGGVSFEEATAAMGILGDAGIKGSQAGTTMRTIMANIVNPTKKQLEAWERIGIKRMDEEGNVRSLVDIFKDLNDADLLVKDFYQIFHKTAAQGAVSLAEHVDKWNEVVMENFMSEGLAQELADKKKNTIQGLWAQLTSMFTENGMRAFEAIEEPIRQFLKEIIEGLKSDQAEKMMRKLGDTVLDIMQDLKGFTKVLIDLFDKFSPHLKLWAELQLKLVAILVPLRIFRSLFNFGKLVATGANEIGLLARKFFDLGKAISGVTRMKGHLGDFWYFAKHMEADWFGANTAVGPRIDPPIQSRLDKIRKQYGDEALDRHKSYVDKIVEARNEKLNLRKVSLARMSAVYGSGILSMAGSMYGAYKGAEIGGEDNLWAPILGGVAGASLGGLIGNHLIPHITTKLLPFLLTNPAGWATAFVAAIGGIAFSFIKYKEAVDDANVANQNYLKSAELVNGINLSEHATMADKYLNIIYSKQMDTNRAIGEHINLMREQLGLMKEGEEKLKGKTLSEAYKEETDAASKAFQGYWGWGIWTNMDDMRENASAQFKLIGGADAVTPLKKEGRKNPYAYEFGGRTYEDNMFDLNKLSVQKYLYTKGADMSEGSALQQIVASFDKMVPTAKTPEDLAAIKKNVDLEIDKLNSQIVSESGEWAWGTALKKKYEEFSKSAAYVKGQTDVLTSYFDYNVDNPTSHHANALKKLNEIMTLKAAGEKIPTSVLADYLRESGALAVKEKLGKFGSAEYMKAFGWYDNKWHAEEFEYYDKDKNDIVKQNVTETQAEQAFGLLRQQMAGIINKLNPELRPLFDDFMNHPMWKYGKSDNNPNGNKNQLSDMVSGDSTDFSTNGLANYTGDPDDYENKYSKSSVAPKQVIVRIENLMNVESVDLNNLDNDMAMETFKQKMTQTLIDVVHDFDESWNGN